MSLQRQKWEKSIDNIRHPKNGGRSTPTPAKKFHKMVRTVAKDKKVSMAIQQKCYVSNGLIIVDFSFLSLLSTSFFSIYSKALVFKDSKCDLLNKFIDPFCILDVVNFEKISHYHL